MVKDVNHIYRIANKECPLHIDKRMKQTIFTAYKQEHAGMLIGKLLEINGLIFRTEVTFTYNMMVVIKIIINRNYQDIPLQ